MIPNIHQSIEDIIKSSTAQQRIIWQQIRLLTGENAGIRQLYYFGAHTRFAAYDANRLYLAYELTITGAYTFYSVDPNILFYDEGNNNNAVACNISPVWDTTGAIIKYQANPVYLNNLMFSRIVSTAGIYTSIKFIGYEIKY